jgi:flagellar basal-body rod protein FlgF
LAGGEARVTEHLMDTPGYVVLSRMSSQQRALDAVAHNLANLETPAYQAERLVFSRFVQPGAIGTRGGPTNYTIDRATWRENAPGPLGTTGNPFDLALRGPGYFVVESPRGDRYTRAGRFTLSDDGRIVDPEGHALLDVSSQPLTIGAADSRIEVMGDGTVRSENGVIGKLRVVQFETPQAMRPEGDRLYTSTEPPNPVERPNVVQGALEGSNVKSVMELTRLTEVTREFQDAANFADAEHDRIRSAIERILRPVG